MLSCGNYPSEKMTEIVNLNVSGKTYSSTVQTLSESPALAHELRSRGAIQPGTQIFIDRDGKLFRHILNFLRSPSTWRLPVDIALLRDLQPEAEFFQLEVMMERLRHGLVGFDGKLTITILVSHGMVITATIKGFAIILGQYLRVIDLGDDRTVTNVVQRTREFAAMEGYELESQICYDTNYIMLCFRTTEISRMLEITIPEGRKIMIERQMINQAQLNAMQQLRY